MQGACAPEFLEATQVLEGLRIIWPSLQVGTGKRGGKACREALRVIHHALGGGARQLCANCEVCANGEDISFPLFLAARLERHIALARATCEEDVCVINDFDTTMVH